MLLSAGLSAGVLASLGLDFLAPRVAFAYNMTTAAGIVEYGKQYLGLPLLPPTGVRADPAMIGTPWYGYEGNWCAWFISWISRGLGHGKYTWASHWDHVLPEIPNGQARVGDYVRMGPWNDAHHIGIVSAVSNGYVTNILDGNRGFASWDTQVVRNDGNYSNAIILRQNYPGGSAPSNGNGEQEVILRATSASASGLISAGHMYSNDIGGHWRGLTNLEGNWVVGPLFSAGKLNLVDTSGDDMERIIGMTGLWEQNSIPLNSIWIASINAYLKGWGGLTGRIRYPGAAGMMGQWHYPVDEHA